MARGLWRITGGTMVIEFADHMTLFEVGWPAGAHQAGDRGGAKDRARASRSPK